MVGIPVVRATRSRLELGQDGIQFRQGLQHIGRGGARGFRDRVGDPPDLDAGIAGTASGAMEDVRGRGAEGGGPGNQIGPAFRRFLR